MLPVHLDRAVILDVLRLVMLDGGVHVVLAVQGDLFLALCVIEDQAVVAAPLGRAVGLEAADHFFLGKLARGHLLGVVDAADDDGLVRVAFEKIDDDLLPNARHVGDAPAFASPDRRNSHPAGAIGVVFAFAVPVELDLDTAIFIAKNLFAGGTNDNRRL